MKRKPICKPSEKSFNFTIDDILHYLHGRKFKVFANKPVKDEDGRIVKWGTPLGEKTYEKLVELICSEGKICNMEKEAEDIVENLDDIVTSNEYERVYCIAGSYNKKKGK